MSRTETDQQKELVDALQAVVDRCHFYHRGSPLAAETVREMYQQGIEGLVGSRRYLEILIDDNDPALLTFIEALRVSVSDCLDDTGCIGDGLVVLMGGGLMYPPVEQYARSFLRPGATLGAETVVKMLYGWLRNDPIRFKIQNALDNRVSGNQTPTIYVIDGVQVSASPKSGQEFYRRFPGLRDTSFDEIEVMGKAFLTVDYISDVPGIFKPNQKMPRGIRAVASNFDVGRFCQALSLVENKNVCSPISWNDYGVLREFNPNQAGFVQYMVRGTGEEISLSKDKLKQAWTISEKLTSGNVKRLKTAIYRWVRSKESETFVNRLIELRIALEALYAGDGPGVTFRLATHGALHLGQNYEERLHHRKLFTKVYDLASRAVHGSRKLLTTEHQHRFEEARDACRKGILKCLDNGGDIDFDKLMFHR